MTNLNFRILFPLFFISLLFGCKTEKPTMKQAEAEIYFRFIEASQELHAEAFFFEKKTTPTPVVWDNVLFINMPMKKRELSPQQIRYIFDLPQPEFKNQYFIKFYNKGELPRQIDIKPSGINSFSFKNSSGEVIDAINKKEGISLAMNAPAFSGKEKFTLLFTNENNETASLQIAPPNTSGQTGISAQALSAVPTGICSVEMIITKADVVENPTAKATVISEFYSQAIQVSVK